MSIIFLGNPKPLTKQYIIDHYCTPSQWDNIVQSLEHFSDSMIGNELPIVGSTTLSTMYDIGDGQIIPLTWQVLGYNSSIPRYVKYKDQSGNKIYVSSMKAASNGNVQGYLLSEIVQNDPVYVKNSLGEYQTNGKTIGSVDGSFTYGQTKEVFGTTATESGSYSVPTSIVVDNKSYSFAGYNMTIATAGTFGAVKDSTYYCYVNFGRYVEGQNYINAWSDSQLRAWLNNYDSDFTEWDWGDYNELYYTIGDTIPKFTTRFNAEDCFLKNVMPVVNRTWLWGTDEFNVLWNSKVHDSSYCEHVVDKFWLLSHGNVNVSEIIVGQEPNLKHYYAQDFKFDTARYSTVFNCNTTDNKDTTGKNARKRKQIAANGSITSNINGWWLRSACYSTILTDIQNDSKRASFVTHGGDILADLVSLINIRAILPACTIG